MVRATRIDRIGLGAALAVTLLGALAGTPARVYAFAVLHQWNNPSGGAANVPGNWTPSGFPGAPDEAAFGLAAYYTVTWPGPRDTVANLVMSAGTVNLSMSGSLGVGNAFDLGAGSILAVIGGTLLVSRDADGPNRDSGALTIDGGSSVFDLNLGSRYGFEGGPSDNANLAIVHGGVFRAHNDLALGDESGRHAYLGIEHRDASLTRDAQLVTADTHGLDLGASGTLNADLYDGGRMASGGDMTLASRHGGSATVTVGVFPGSFASSVFVGGACWIGANALAGADAGTARLTIGNGSGTFEGRCWLGDPDDSVHTGAVTPEGVLAAGSGSHLVFANGLTMSRFHTGEFDLVDGTTQILGGTSDIRQRAPFAIEGPSGASPHLWLEGGSITHVWPNDLGGPALGVGRANTGELRVAGAGTQLVVHGRTLVADSLGGYATMVVDSAASAQLTGPLGLGGGGIALFTVTGAGGSLALLDSLVMGGASGAVILRVDSLATLTVAGPTTIAPAAAGGSASLFAFQGAHATLAGVTVGPGPGNMEAGVAGGRIDITGHFDVGGLAHTLIDSAGVIAYTGAPALRVGPVSGGWLIVDSGARLQSNAEIDVRGRLTLSSGVGDLALAAATGTAKSARPARPAVAFTGVSGVVQCGLTRVLTGGALDGLGIVQGRLHLDSGTATLTTAADLPSYHGALTAGDSTRSDGFVSIGQTTVAAGDTLRLLDLDGADLGKMTVNGVLLLPRTGHLAAGFRLDGPGSVNGSLEVRDSAWTSLSGGVSGDVALGGTLDLGSAPPPPPGPESSASYSRSLTIGSFHPTATGRTTLVIGSTTQDQLVVTGAAVLGGTLDVRSVPGQTITTGTIYTLVSAGTISGTFASVTVNGHANGGQITMLYGPTTVKAVVSGAITAVADGAAPGANLPATLRFRATGMPRDAALALDLPTAAEVRVTLYDVGGRQLATLAAGGLAAGRHRFRIAGAAARSGMYFARAEIAAADGTRVLTARVVALR